jgi:SOS response regulatory protein OraA/RecX
MTILKRVYRQRTSNGKQYVAELADGKILRGNRGDIRRRLAERGIDQEVIESAVLAADSDDCTHSHTTASATKICPTCQGDPSLLCPDCAGRGTELIDSDES